MTDHERIHRFDVLPRVNHLLVIVTFVGLVLTGFPQKYSAQDWAKGVTLIFGGVERMRFLHHFLGTVMCIQLGWHLLELGWMWIVRSREMNMLPKLKDMRDFVQQVKYGLGLAKEGPRMGRYTFAEKMEYLALIWGTILMVATGVVLLYPIRFASILPGQVIPAAKAAHGGEALLALLAVITWHFYHVHIAFWNPSMFSGKLRRDVYQHEHALELEEIMTRGRPRGAAITTGRLLTFGVLTAATVYFTVRVLGWLGVAGNNVTVGSLLGW
jgi:cytochrome b subunit of formate dehydrogenase